MVLNRINYEGKNNYTKKQSKINSTPPNSTMTSLKMEPNIHIPFIITYKVFFVF